MSAQDIKKFTKKEREKKILLGLVEQFIETGEPVGSHSLKEAEFQEISSATIRNYYTTLESEGFLKRLHASGGGIPTQKAYRLYASENVDATKISNALSSKIRRLEMGEMKEITLYLQQAAETLSQLTNYAVFLSAPRFDHDYIADLKLVPIDYQRFLSVIVTDFGVIQTELLHTEQRLSAFAIKRIEGYFHFRLTGQDKPENLSADEEKLAQKFYNELMLRYIVGYSTFVEEQIYRTGFSKLLQYQDFHDTKILASSLSLFESANSMRLLLKDCSSHNVLKYWIGDDLAPYSTSKLHCTVLTAPYKINEKTVGAIGLLGPIRMPYKELFALLRAFTESISKTLTQNIYKFKITFREPKAGHSYLQQEEHRLLGQSRLLLLEDKTLMES